MFIAFSSYSVMLRALGGDTTMQWSRRPLVEYQNQLVLPETL